MPALQVDHCDDYIFYDDDDYHDNTCSTLQVDHSDDYYGEDAVIGDSFQ